MHIRRLPFIGLLLLVFVCPFYVSNAIWLWRSEKTIGTAAFRGKEFAGQLVHNYTVIMFVAEKDTFFYNTSDNIFFDTGSDVPVRYQPDDPRNAKLGTWSGLWMETIFYSAMPFLIVVIILIHPSFIPYRSVLKCQRRKPYFLISDPPSQN